MQQQLNGATIMKKLTAITAIGISSVLWISPVSAQDVRDNRTEQNIGFSSGLIIGAVAGGPIGAILGAVTGVWLGDKVNEADKVDGLVQEIALNKEYLATLNENIALQNTQLDNANIQLAHQEAQQMKVARNKDLITGLQVDLMFRTNSVVLEPTAIQKIAPLVLMLEQFPQLELELTGHSDILGSKSGNKQVAQDRTLTVQQSFVDAGIDSARIHLVNSSNAQAVSNLEDVDGRALERRVRIRFMHSEAQASFAFK